MSIKATSTPTARRPWAVAALVVARPVIVVAGWFVIGVVAIALLVFPKLALGKRKCQHGVILKIVATNICGSDQHMVRGRTTAPTGLILGHERPGVLDDLHRGVRKDGRESMRVLEKTGVRNDVELTLYAVREAMV